MWCQGLVGQWCYKIRNIGIAQICLECVFGLFVFLRYSLNFVVPASEEWLADPFEHVGRISGRPGLRGLRGWRPLRLRFAEDIRTAVGNLGHWGCRGFLTFFRFANWLVWGNRCKFCRRGGDTLFLECDQCCNLQTKTGLFSLKKFCDSENPKSSIMHGFVENYLFQMRGNQYWRYIHFISIFHFQYCTQNMRFWEDCNQHVKFPLKFWKYPSSDSTTPKDPGMS